MKYLMIIIMMFFSSCTLFEDCGHIHHEVIVKEHPLQGLYQLVRQPVDAIDPLPVQFEIDSVGSFEIPNKYFGHFSTVEFAITREHERNGQIEYFYTWNVKDKSGKIVGWYHAKLSLRGDIIFSTQRFPTSKKIDNEPVDQKFAVIC